MPISYKKKPKRNPPTVLKGKAASLWERIYDAIYEKFKDAKKAASIAWHHVKQKYEKDIKTGKWKLKKVKEKTKKAGRKIKENLDKTDLTFEAGIGPAKVRVGKPPKTLPPVRGSKEDKKSPKKTRTTKSIKNYR